MSFTILFVSHEASATGAPIFLLNFARWLKANVPGINIKTLVIKNGVFFDQWQKLGPTVLLQGLDEAAVTAHTREMCKNGVDIVYFNTIETSHMLSLFAANDWFGMRCKSVLHVHELEGTVQKYGASKVQAISHIPDRIIAVSEPVRRNLAERHGFEREKIEIVYPCARDFGAVPIKKFDMKPMVLGCGEVAIVKGTDLFLQVAQRIVQQKEKQVRFEWLGIDSHGILPYLKNDTKKLALDDVLSFPGHRDEVSDWFAAADVFFLSSREDSCPLVCLEAASRGLPIVYFNKSGGMDDVLGDAAGFPVPYMDLEAAAKTLLHVLAHPDEAAERGKKAQAIYRRQHQPEIVYRQLFERLPR